MHIFNPNEVGILKKLDTIVSTNVWNRYLGTII